MDSNRPANYLTLCRREHGLTEVPEGKLERGDVLGFLMDMRRLGFQMDRIEAALKAYKLLTEVGV